MIAFNSYKDVYQRNGVTVMYDPRGKDKKKNLNQYENKEDGLTNR